MLTRRRSPGASGTRAHPARRFEGSPAECGNSRYSCATSTPARSPGVGEVKGDREIGIHGEIGVGERRIGQPISELVRGSFLLRVVPPISHRQSFAQPDDRLMRRRDVRLHGVCRRLRRVRARQVRLGARETDRQPAGRADAAEQDVGDRFRAAIAGIPGREDRPDMPRPRRQYRASGLEDDDGPRIGGRHLAG